MSTLGQSWQVSRTRSTVSADSPGRTVRFAAHRQPLCCNFTYHSRIVLCVDGSVWYMVRNHPCTVTIDSVLANSKTQNAFFFPVHAMFRHDCHLAVKLASRSRFLLPKQTWTDSLPIDMFLSPVSVLVFAQPSSAVLQGLMNYPVLLGWPDQGDEKRRACKMDDTTSGRKPRRTALQTHHFNLWMLLYLYTGQ
jgi:hypothetical protein